MSNYFIIVSEYILKHFTKWLATLNIMSQCRPTPMLTMKNTLARLEHRYTQNLEMVAKSMAIYNREYK